MMKIHEAVHLLKSGRIKAIRAGLCSDFWIYLPESKAYVQKYIHVPQHTGFRISEKEMKTYNMLEWNEFKIEE